MFNSHMREQDWNEERDAELSAWLAAYRDACPDPDPSANFMPGVWAKIEARQTSTTMFSRMAKALVTAALAATVILGLMISTYSSVQSEPFNGTYIEALTADHALSLEPLNLERISELEQQ
jgi:hypothetical protein